MATRKFKSSNEDGGGVTIWRNGASEIRVPTDGTYETDDKAEIDALKSSPEVVEVKEKEKK